MYFLCFFSIKFNSIKLWSKPDLWMSLYSVHYQFYITHLKVIGTNTTRITFDKSYVWASIRYLYYYKVWGNASNCKVISPPSLKDKELFLTLTYMKLISSQGFLHDNFTRYSAIDSIVLWTSNNAIK